MMAITKLEIDVNNRQIIEKVNEMIDRINEATCPGMSLEDQSREEIGRFVHSGQKTADAYNLMLEGGALNKRVVGQK
jgi:hypothetical protein